MLKLVALYFFLERLLRILPILTLIVSIIIVILLLLLLLWHWHEEIAKIHQLLHLLIVEVNVLP